MWDIASEGAQFVQFRNAVGDLSNSEMRLKLFNDYTINNVNPHRLPSPLDNYCFLWLHTTARCTLINSDRNVDFLYNVDQILLYL